MTKEIFVLAAGYFNSGAERYEKYQEVIANVLWTHFGTSVILDCRNYEPWTFEIIRFEITEFFKFWVLEITKL